MKGRNRARDATRRLAGAAFGEHAFQTTVLVLFLLVAVIVLSSLTDRFLTGPNLVVILQAMAVLVIASIGQTLAIVSGGFDLSVGGVIPLASVAFVVAANGFGPGGFLAGLAVAILLGVAAGLLNGVFVTKLRINPLIATLGMLSVAGGSAYLLTNGVTVPLRDFDSGVLADRAIGSVTWDVFLMAALVAVGFVILRFTIWGRIVYAVGGSLEAARRAGIRTDRALISIYATCGGLAAVAGVVAANQLLAGAPSTYGEASLSTITAVILGGAALSGGRGGVVGTLFGALLVGVIANGLKLLQVNSFYQTVITGLILLLAVALSRIRDNITHSGTAL